MITLNVFVRVKPEHREELLAVGHTLFNDLAQEPTFIAAWINASVGQAALVAVYERCNDPNDSFLNKLLRRPPSAPPAAPRTPLGPAADTASQAERCRRRAAPSPHARRPLPPCPGQSAITPPVRPPRA